ncbi:UDP-N-acetylglucosamine 1-carboxyvinyltransferase [Candidatus Dojkabacteria bacterium]|nr:UDP-N-acetylglucosamine 1-carboxyvinyltransferase [Candidatus Dojkabacteria bacterium]
MNLLVRGGGKLAGTVVPSGNKNAILPILCSTLLTKEKVLLRNVPDLTDVDKLVEIMKQLGSKISWDKSAQVLEVMNDEISLDRFDGCLPMGMRASVLLFAPLAFRGKTLKIGTKIEGCQLGIRELDTHYRTLRALGAEVNVGHGSVEIKLKDRFIGGEHWEDYMSVTTTENFIMAACCAKGKSVLMNAASEPHVQDLANFLNSIGAKISGIGTSRLEVEGVGSLGGGEHEIISDHHEIATFLALGAMTGGRVEVEKSLPEHFGLINNSFRKLGVEVEYHGDKAFVSEGQKLEVQIPDTKHFVPKIEIHPWPYFPTDLLPLMVALATRAKGQIMFWNKMYEGSLFWVSQLSAFGVKSLICDPHRALIWGGLPLYPAIIEAPDIIRATVAMFMIAQSIDGESTIVNADPIKRAHPEFEEKMISLGADVAWV